MSSFPNLPSLRNLLLIDAITCALMGVLLTLGSGALAELTAIPSALLLAAGLSLLPIAGFMAVVATRPIHPAATWLVIVGNGMWVAGSLVLLLVDWFTPNALGTGFIIAQAVAVAVLAWLELAALRGTSHPLRTG